MLQRWISADPLTIHTYGGDLNAYAYVRGQALKATDPLGLEDYRPPAGPGVDSTMVAPVEGMGSGSMTLGDNSVMLEEITIPGSVPELRSPIGPGAPGVPGMEDVRGAIKGAWNQSVATAEFGYSLTTPGLLQRATGDGPDFSAAQVGVAPNEEGGALIGTGAVMAAPVAELGALRSLRNAQRLELTMPEIGAGVGAGRRAPFNPSGARNNCVNGVCAFIDSVKNRQLTTAGTDVAENLGSVRTVAGQVEARTGVTVSTRGQFNALETARERQFFLVFRGSNPNVSDHVLMGINNRGRQMLYDPQTHQKFMNPSEFGSFMAFPIQF